MLGRNNIRLWTVVDGKMVSHFRLKEFENPDGLAVVHEQLLVALEKTRRDLCEKYERSVEVIITCGVRTQQDQERLAKVLGWADKGGAVARDSKHLPKWGGVAVDLKAVMGGTRIPQRTLGDICRRHFDWVKDDYADGHVHADVRNATGK